MKRGLSSLVLAAAVLLLVVATVSGRTPDWDYKSGGSNWVGQCSSKKFQSPIDLNLPIGSGGADSEDLNIHYPVVNAWQTGMKVVHTGKAIQVNARNKDLGYIFHEGSKYYVRDFHFHSPSEHTIRGKQFPLEVQIVHQKDGSVGDKDLLMLSALYKQVNGTQRDPSTFLSQALYWDHLPTHAGKQELLTDPFQLGLALDGLHNGYYQYLGSTTTPPCTNNVVWNVLETIQEATPMQILKINRLFQGNPAFAAGRGNNRKVQPLGGRRVRLHSHKPFSDGDGNYAPVARTQPEMQAPLQAHDTLGVSPEDLPVASAATTPIPNRPATLPALYQRHGSDWSGYCREGRYQSPINIIPQVGSPHGDYEMKVDYEPAPGNLTNDGSTIRLTGNFGILNITSGRGESKVPFKAVSVTMHSPAEHKVDGRRADMELQITHERGVGNTYEQVIVSVLLTKSFTKRNELFRTLSWNALPSEGHFSNLDHQLINLSLLKGFGAGYYSYVGSLSKPPCTQGVKRFVLRTYNDVSAFQLKQFQKLFYGNSRATQNTNGRGITTQGVNDHKDALFHAFD